MSGRVETALRAKRAAGGKALVPFLTGEFPDGPTFERLLFGAEAAGADAVEVGIPFSDPAADGPVIQETSRLALEGGATVASLLARVAACRSRGLKVPLLLMTYYNPILAFGPKAFCGAAREAGVDGMLVVDLPPEEAEELTGPAAVAGLETVFLVAPTTPERRLPVILEHCRGFVYCVSVTGVTGGVTDDTRCAAEVVARVRRHTDLPALVGFGVAGPESAQKLAAVSDGVIVGTALLRAIGGLRGEAAAAAATLFLEGLGVTAA
ncbi:MAG: tryptophan synthase subunit alpha [Thermoleophilia bacterium]